MLRHHRYIGKKGMLPKFTQRCDRTAKKTEPSTVSQKVRSKGSPLPIPTTHDLPSPNRNILPTLFPSRATY